MSVTVHGHHHGAAVVEDASGEIHTIPLSWHSAIDGAMHTDGLVELDHCTFDADGRECDQAALTTDLRDRPVCYRHAPDDDKDA